MSSAGDMIMPIVGLATNQFIPLTDISYIFACLFLPIECATLLFWIVILVAIVKDRHYEDPNNLLIVSFALADIVCTSTSLHSNMSLALDHGYSRGFTGCAWEAYFITVGFCASGLSVVVIAIDRYLLMCHGYFASWSKTGILLLICWFLSLVVSALVIFTTLPNSIILANGMLCYPDFSSSDPVISGLLIMALSLMFLSLATVVFCYANVFLKYQSMLRRREGGGEISRNENIALSPKSKVLLKKLVLITVTSFSTFQPIVISFSVMMATKAEVHDNVELMVLTIFVIGLLLNPILIYLLDAKMKRSVNEILGFNKIMPKKKPVHTKKPAIEMENPDPKRNVLQLNSPIHPANTYKSPNDISTVLLIMK